MKTPKSFLLLASLVGAPVAAFAADPTVPVKTVIEVAAGNWSETSPTANDVFDNERLGQLFSADFANVYREASKHPAYDPPEGETTGSPFDYDPIAGGQEGCAFENIRVEDDGEGQVTALFNNRKCLGDDPAYKEDTVLIFHVVEEQGRTVIDDMYRIEDGQSGKSLKDELKDIAGQ